MANSMLYRATQRGNISVFDCTEKDAVYLRDLAKKVSELAGSERNKELRKLWVAHGSLRRTRPLIICDPENGWNEILKLRCESTSGRAWEFLFLKKIFWAEKMLDDMVIEPTLEIPYTYSESDWVGDGTVETITEFGGHAWTAMMREGMTAEDAKTPVLEVDLVKTNAVIDYANDIFKSIIKVHLRGKWWHSLGMTNTLGELRGFENIYYDLYDNPGLIKELLEKILAYNLWKLDYLEKNNLMSFNNDMLDVPAGVLGYTSDLPSEGEHVKTSDLWGWLEAQEVSDISPQMFEEFISPYHQRLAEKFGLISYGCCEKMDERIDFVKKMKNLRRVSVSPWSDKFTMAEKLGRDYIYAWKYNPVTLASGNVDADEIEAEAAPVLKKLYSCGCNTEIIMKDNHTIGKNPKAPAQWVRLMREIAENG